MAPVTLLAKYNQPFIWGEEQQGAFNETNPAVAKAILCIYPDPNKPFIIYPDALQKYAMGAMLAQNLNGTEQIISVFSRKFNDAKLKYTIGEQKLLAAFKACMMSLYGCDIIICCDHMNITRAETKHTSLHVLRQHITLDQDYGTNFEHIAGEQNTGVDGLSRLAMSDTIPENLITEIYAIDNLNQDINSDFPLSMSLIKAEQDKDTNLQSLLKKEMYKWNFGMLTFGSIDSTPSTTKFDLSGLKVEIFM